MPQKELAEAFVSRVSQFKLVHSHNLPVFRLDPPIPFRSGVATNKKSQTKIIRFVDDEEFDFISKLFALPFFL